MIQILLEMNYNHCETPIWVILIPSSKQRNVSRCFTENHFTEKVFGRDSGDSPENPKRFSACLVGWFVSLLVCLCEREVLLASSGEQYSCEGAGQPSDQCSLFVWLWLVVNDRKFSVRTVFFSHTNQPAILLHEPTTIRTSQPNRLWVWIVDSSRFNLI